nr:MAG TPA: hypothetical protein [Caudoviricetes sp.]DAS94377.1 MAG TPA: hypothetical protein [Caudoviricetes sp.]DAW30856.1 MAG TPA: hypothetical protein [Caudoviricetes sp.]
MHFGCLLFYSVDFFICSRSIEVFKIFQTE